MAYFKIRRHVLQTPENWAAICRSFTKVEEFSPVQGEAPFKWYKVSGPGIPGDDVEIELNFTIKGGADGVDIQWRLKNQL